MTQADVEERHLNPLPAVLERHRALPAAERADRPPHSAGPQAREAGCKRAEILLAQEREPREISAAERGERLLNRAVLAFERALRVHGGEGQSRAAFPESAEDAPPVNLVVECVNVERERHAAEKRADELQPLVQVSRGVLLEDAVRLETEREERLKVRVAHDFPVRAHEERLPSRESRLPPFRLFPQVRIHRSRLAGKPGNVRSGRQIAKIPR